MHRLLARSLFLAALLFALQAAAAEAVFPLKKSANGRYLIDQKGQPFFVHGDSPWSLIAQLDKRDAERYLDMASQTGRNAIIVNVIEHKFADNPPFNRAGDAPFTTPGDFTTPNEAYFAHADWVLRKAAEKGFVVLLFPAWAAAQKRDGGWNQEIEKNGPEKCRAFGRYLGQRYKDFTNIIWGHGGDQNPEPDSAMARNMLEILLGIKDAAPNHMHFYHGRRGKTSIDQDNFAPHVNLDAVYTSSDLQGADRIGEPYTTSLRAYNRKDYLPYFLFEGVYEKHGAPRSPTIETSDPGRLRRQHYWVNLCGSTGHLFGNYPAWALAIGWDGPTGLLSPGNQDMKRLKDFWTSLAWWRLVPDQDHTSVTSGYGTYKEGDYVTAGRTDDGRLMVAYVPSTGTTSRTLVVDLARLSDRVHARWFNPATGEYTKIPGSPFANKERREFVTPGDNGSGANDWALILEAGH